MISPKVGRHGEAAHDKARLSVLQRRVRRLDQLHL